MAMYQGYDQYKLVWEDIQALIWDGYNPEIIIIDNIGLYPFIYMVMGSKMSFQET